MPGRTIRQMLWLWMVLAAVLAGEARAQPPIPRGKVITWQTAENQSETFVGVLGEIARPGVYRIEPTALSLQVLLRRAGGLTGDASHTIRVVRQERVVQSLFYSPDLDSPLMPNDLLIVESKKSQAATSQLDGPDARLQALQQASGTATESNGIQVAFLNVLDRPVIVKVKHENARLDHVVQMLDQPIELAQAVRVLGSDPSSRATPSQILSTLTDGSVLVFPRNSINRGKLPPLPLPYESEIAAGAFPSLIGGPSGQSPELHNVGRLAPMIAREVNPGFQPNSSYQQTANPSPAPLPHSEYSGLTPPRLDIQGSAVPTASTPPRVATLPFSGEPRVTSSSTRTLTDDRLPATNNYSSNSHTTARTFASAGSASQQIVPDPRDDAGSSIDDRDALLKSDDKAEGSTFSLAQMLGILCCVAGLIGAALLVRRHLDLLETRRGGMPSLPAVELPDSVQHRGEAFEPPEVVEAVPNSPPAEPAPAAVLPPMAEVKETTLDRLIRNELPLKQERIAFPSQIVLQGRVAPRPQFRVDPAATRMQGHRPHFPIQTPASPEIQAAVADPVMPAAISPKPIATDQLDAPHAAHPAKPHFLQRRSAERTVAAAAAAGPAMKRSDDVRSRTPVTDALRQLQGGES